MPLCYDVLGRSGTSKPYLATLQLILGLRVLVRRSDSGGQSSAWRLGYASVRQAGLRGFEGSVGIPRQCSSNSSGSEILVFISSSH